jgi:Domain of unknown function (DUF222)
MSTGIAASADEPLTPAELAWWDAGLDPGDLEDDGPDPSCAPPGGDEAWLADLAAPVRERYLAALPAQQAEALAAGFWDRSDEHGPGFAAGGVADRMLPGRMLAGFTGAAWRDGLDGLSDDELIGVTLAARRNAAWQAALELSAVTELVKRRCADGALASSTACEHVNAEIAAAFTLTGRAADNLLSLAAGLERLPQALALLANGIIDRPRAAVIVSELACLPDEQASDVAGHVLPRAGQLTTSQLSAALRRAILAVDPEAASRRRKKAEREARVETWQESAGTSTIAGRDLPPSRAIAADKYLTAAARWLRDQGVEGTLDLLRARVFTTLLSGQSVQVLLPDPGPGTAETANGRDRSVDTTVAGQSAIDARGIGFAGLSADGGRDIGGRDIGNRAVGSACQGTNGVSAVGLAAASTDVIRTGALALTGTVHLTMPAAAWLGLTDAPGEVAGWGPLDAGTCRDLAAAMSAASASRWCLTITGGDGRAVAHGCARGRPGSVQARRNPGPSGAPDPRPADARDPRPADARDPGPADARDPQRAHARDPEQAHARDPQQAYRRDPGPADAREPGPAGARDPGPPDARVPGPPEMEQVRWLTGQRLHAVASGTCAHEHEAAGYRPSSLLRHLVKTRQPNCSFPGCWRQAGKCDDDHTVPYEQGGKTCECNLSPLCRQHHRAKQAAGWNLSQAAPGTLIWSLPHGRTYTIAPHRYPDV